MYVCLLKGKRAAEWDFEEVDSKEKRKWEANWWIVGSFIGSKRS